jgi:hypothetical protein
MVGMDTNKRALFNSNKEASPSTRANDSYYNNSNDGSSSSRQQPAINRISTNEPSINGNITISK